MGKSRIITNEKLPLGYGYSIRYNHQPGGPNFDRANNGQVMLLSNHDSSIDKILGTVKNAHHDNNASYVDMDLLEIEDDPAIKRANALLQNNMQGVSAGILVHDAHVEGKTLEVDKWELVELSLTPIPRDAGTNIEGFIANEGGVDGLIDRFFKNSTQEAPPITDPSTGPPTESNSTEDEMPTLEEIGTLIQSNNESLVEGIGNKLAEALATVKNDDTPPSDPPEDKTKEGETREKPEGAPTTAETEENSDPHRKEGHPVKCFCNECETLRNEAAKPSPDHPAIIKNMTEIAVTQARFDKEKVLELYRNSVEEGWDKDQYKEKLESIAIHPSPFAPLSNDQQSGYDLGRALTDMMRGRSAGTPEQSISDEIMNKTELPIYNPNTLAIPWEIIKNNTKYSGTQGVDSAADAVQEELLPMIRRDIPDPLNIIPLFTRLPSTPGDTYVVYIDVPDPGMVPEPGDVGYAKTGDSHTSKVPLTPKLQVDRVLITRLAGVTVPTLLTSILGVGLQKMTEQMSRLSLRGGGGDEVVGLLGRTTNQKSKEIAALTDVTSKIITDGLDRSFQFTPAEKVIVVSPEIRTHLRTVARPSAVGTFFTGEGVDGTPVLHTDYMKYMATSFPNEDASGTAIADNANAQTKAGAVQHRVGGGFRGLIFPPRDVYFKQWDDAVFVHTRYEDGNQIMVLETFWNFIPTHSELYYEIQDNTPPTWNSLDGFYDRTGLLTSFDSMGHPITR